MEKVCVDFLIQCYFGDVSNPILASIDRAYVDMQTHTLSGKKEALFAGRKIGTEIIYNAISELQEVEDFDEWHRSLANVIQQKYFETTKNAGEQIELRVGQIQKWINMTLKYCFVLKQLGVEKISDYFNEENASCFHTPLDSYVLEKMEKEDVKWSKIEEYDVYDEIRKSIQFFDELKNWPTWANESKYNKDGKERKADIGTYKRYIQDETEERRGYSFKE